MVTTGERGQHIFGIVELFFFLHFGSVVDAYEFHGKSEFAGYQLDNIGFQALVDGHHHTQAHTFPDNFGVTHIHQVRQFAYADEFRDLQPAVHHIVAACLVGHFFAFGTAIFGFQTLSTAAGSCQLSLCLTYLFLYLFLIDLLRLTGCMARIGPAIAAAMAMLTSASMLSAASAAIDIPLYGDTLSFRAAALLTGTLLAALVSAAAVLAAAMLSAALVVVWGSAATAAVTAMSFFSIGMRLRFLFSSAGCFGLVSLLTGSSIFPRILGPSNFSALIFSITGGTSCSSTAGTGASSTWGWGASTTAGWFNLFFYFRKDRLRYDNGLFPDRRLFLYRRSDLYFLGHYHHRGLWLCFGLLFRLFYRLFFLYDFRSAVLFWPPHHLLRPGGGVDGRKINFINDLGTFQFRRLDLGHFWLFRLFLFHGRSHEHSLWFFHRGRRIFFCRFLYDRNILFDNLGLLFFFFFASRLPLGRSIWSLLILATLSP